MTTREEVTGFEKKQQMLTKYKRTKFFYGSQVFFTIAKKYTIRYQINFQMQKVHCGNETVKEFPHVVNTDSSNYLHYVI